MSVPWQQGTPWQAQPWMQQQPPLNQPPAWAGATAAVSPTLWQQATATQPQGGTQAQPTWAGGQAGPTWAAADPGAQQSLGGAPWMANAKTGDTDLSKAPLPGAASSQGLTQDAPYTWTGAAQSPNAGGALATMPSQPINVPPDTWEAWLNQSGNLGGQQFVNGRWQGGGPVAVGSGVLGQSGMKTSVAYDARKDTSLYEFNGVANSESNWHRVNRWAMDSARNGVPPQQAYDQAVQRLKQEGIARGADLNTLGFDFSGQQGAGIGTTPPPRTDSNTPYTPTPTTSLPGTQTQDPGPTTQQPTTPTGGTSHSFGQLQTNDMASLLQAAANDPDRAAQILRLAQGQSGRPLGRMADFRDSLYGRSFQTALSLAGTDGQKDLQGIANDFLNQGVLGNDLIGYTGNQARQALGQDFSGVDSATMEKILRAALAEQGINMGSLGGSVQQGRLDDIVYDDWARNLGDSGNDTRNFSDLLNGSRFQQSMANYGRR